jgi:hypothetical protein
MRAQPDLQEVGRTQDGGAEQRTHQSLFDEPLGGLQREIHRHVGERHVHELLHAGTDFETVTSR